MIPSTLRESILTLSARGLSKRQIAIALNASRTTVRRVIHKGRDAPAARKE